MSLYTSLTAIYWLFIGALAFLIIAVFIIEIRDAKRHRAHEQRRKRERAWCEGGIKARVVVFYPGRMMHFFSLVFMAFALQGCIEDHHISWESIEVGKPCDPNGYKGMPVREVFLDYKRPHVLVVCMPNEQGEDSWREIVTRGNNG